MTSTFVARVTRGTVFAAVVASLVAAAATGLVSVVLVQRAEDRRLVDAARVLADELGSESPESAVEDELRETAHMGVTFAVFDATGARLAGDARIQPGGDGSCSTWSAHRSCIVTAPNGMRVAAGGPHGDLAPLLFFAAICAAVLAALVAVVIGRPLARSMVAPLSRLRERVSAAGPLEATLGADEGVEEVDSLRRALEQTLQRLTVALGHAERFAADVAHELRTPLTAVRGELELLHATQRTAELDRVHATVSRLEVLVERLLVLATPPDARAEFDEAVSLRDVIDDVFAALPAESRARVQLVGEVDATVRGDATLLQAMVSNAVSNALKFGTTATVELLPARDGSATVRVDDAGPGVPPEAREKAFEPFYRLGEARRISGHGLGLALIAHIARRHGGSARFVDAPRGARLELTVRAS
ncbi:MAG: HAMP domain-containing sensor histidine kinase [Archangium sp.]